MMSEIEEKVTTYSVTLAPEAALLMSAGLLLFLFVLTVYAVTYSPPSGCG